MSNDVYPHNLISFSQQPFRGGCGNENTYYLYFTGREIKVQIS